MDFKKVILKYKKNKNKNKITTLQLTYPFTFLLTCLFLKGEIMTPNHYHFPKGKTKGVRSMPYYSIERNYLH
jgi:hypothetical protein